MSDNRAAASLQAISDGYTGKIEHGYLVVENPNATPQSIALGGVDPNLAVSAAAVLSLLGNAPSESVGWQPIETAKKNRQPILAKFYDDIYPRLRPERDDLKRWNGVQVVLRHPGVSDDGFDIGWGVAAPVGCGGFPDEWIEGWKPLDAPPTSHPSQHSQADEKTGGVG